MRPPTVPQATVVMMDFLRWKYHNKAVVGVARRWPWQPLASLLAVVFGGELS